VRYLTEENYKISQSDWDLVRHTPP
jgi:hypothetical protein